MKLLVAIAIIGVCWSAVDAACSPGMYINTCERLNLYDIFDNVTCDSYTAKGNKYCCEHRICREGETEKRCMRACVNNYLLCSLERKVRPSTKVAEKCTDFFNGHRHCNMDCFKKSCYDTIEALSDTNKHQIDVDKFEAKCICLYELACYMNCWNGSDLTDLNIGWNKVYKHPEDTKEVQKLYLPVLHEDLNYYGNCDKAFSGNWQKKQSDVIKTIEKVNNLN